jgi:3-oxoacyl-[acyl-carrier protein] reductase
MSFSLKGRVALITGATTGLGKATAFALARAGAGVAVNYYRDEARAERAYKELKQEALTVELLRADATTEEGVATLYERTMERLGPIDILVINATGDQPQKTIEDYTWHDYEEMIRFFIKSPYLLTRACLPHMKRNMWGRIINLGSEVFNRGPGRFSAYVTAKGGQTGFTRSMATELAPFGITVNMIAPGWIPVERHNNDPQEMRDAYLRTIPMCRWGTPEDVANAVLYFASEAAAFVTGQYLCVNGGMTPM